MARHIVPIKKGILTPHHRKCIGVAIWEFMWMIDHVTRETNGVGIVLGGRPVTYKQVAKDFGLSPDRVRENISKLVSGGYLGQKRTPQGFSYTVNKSSKFDRSDTALPPTHKQDSDTAEMPTHSPKSELAKTPTHKALTDTALPPTQEKSESALPPPRVGTSADSDTALPPTLDQRFSRDSNEIHKSLAPDLPAPARTMDPAHELFDAKYRVLYEGFPYRHKAKDFVSLARLRGLLSLGSSQVPDGWVRALQNYFATPQGTHTIADLCDRYETFLRSALDRFNKPVRASPGSQKPGIGAPREENDEYEHLTEH